MLQVRVQRGLWGAPSALRLVLSNGRRWLTAPWSTSCYSWATYAPANHVWSRAGANDGDFSLEMQEALALGDGLLLESHPSCLPLLLATRGKSAIKALIRNVSTQKHTHTHAAPQPELCNRADGAIVMDADLQSSLEGVTGSKGWWVVARMLRASLMNVSDCPLRKQAPRKQCPHFLNGFRSTLSRMRSFQTFMAKMCKRQIMILPLTRHLNSKFNTSSSSQAPFVEYVILGQVYGSLKGCVSVDLSCRQWTNKRIWTVCVLTETLGEWIYER